MNERDSRNTPDRQRGSRMTLLDVLRKERTDPKKYCPKAGYTIVVAGKVYGHDGSDSSLPAMSKERAEAYISNKSIEDAELRQVDDTVFVMNMHGDTWNIKTREVVNQL